MSQGLEVSSFISEILKSDRRVLSAVFKDKSDDVVEFLASINTDHPDLNLKKIGQNHPVIRSAMELSKCFFENSDFELCDLSLLVGDITPPVKSGRQTRLLKGGLLQKGRSVRSPFEFSSSGFHSSCSRMWHTLPSDFIPVNDQSDVGERLSSIGCHKLAKSYQDTIRQIEETDIGLRIPIKYALCILAKKNQFVLKKDELGNAVVMKSNKRYRPTVCPTHKFPELLSEKAKGMMADLDDPHPIFDHYLMTIPTVDSSVKFPSGEFCVALLGEKDGVCYFLCDWTTLSHENRN